MTIINENIIRKIVAEAITNIFEKRSVANNKKISSKKDAVAKSIYGDEYGQPEDEQSRLYGVNVTKDASVGELFSVGNKKLSDDTLIINFTSALGCPSVKVCPMTQKACYAVAGENRLPYTRRKNIMVQNLWKKAEHTGKLGEMFELAETYIDVLKNSSKPIKYIRFNEAGDFTSQKLLEVAADFAYRMEQKYGVLSMAYTANNKLDYMAEVDGLPIDKIIKINASRSDIKLSPDTTHQNFFGIAMDFKNALASNDKVEEISDDEANKLKCAGTEGEIHSIPRLNWGKWNGGEGWYYVCPCSFWKYNKDKAVERFLILNGLLEHGVEITDKERYRLINLLSEDKKKELNSIINKVVSPCGRECAVCHDKQGGITPDGEIIKDYAVLTATHGNGKGNYDAAYANAKRGGNDNVKWKGNNKNPYGFETKYRDALKKKEKSQR